MLSLNKKLILLTSLLVLLLFVISACQKDEVGRRIFKKSKDMIKPIEDRYSKPSDFECRLGQIRQCGETDVGICKYGTQICKGGKWSRCYGAKYPQEEICGNNKDEDCDGNNECDACLHLIENHNDLNANRINMIFVGLNYSGVNEFKDKVLGILNVGGGSPGFFEQAPFAGNQDKFNFWYINKIEDYDGRLYYPDFQGLFSKCDYLNLNNEQKIGFIKADKPSGAFFGWGFVFYEDRWEGISNPLAHNVQIFLHEFGHSFGWLADEYLYNRPTWSGNTNYNEIPERFENINVPDESQACENWCSGEPVPLESLKDYDCSQFRNQDDCSRDGPHNRPCIFINENYPILINGAEHSGCLNVVDLCLPINNRETCKNLTNTMEIIIDGVVNIYEIEVCKWGYMSEGLLRRQHPYFNSSCIPTEKFDSFQIGDNCIDNTGCYYQAFNRAYFRSSITSKMKRLFMPWGYVNENILRNKLNAFVTKPEYKKLDEHIISFDDFDKKGEVIDGGTIHLASIKKSTRDVLLSNVNKRANILDERGNVDYNKINIEILIEEYKKLSEKEEYKKSK